jgi:hypothetical protein
MTHTGSNISATHGMAKIATILLIDVREFFSINYCKNAEHVASASGAQKPN